MLPLSKWYIIRSIHSPLQQIERGQYKMSTLFLYALSTVKIQPSNKIMFILFPRISLTLIKASKSDVLHKRHVLNLFNNIFTIVKKYVIIYITETNSFAL